MLVTIYTHRHTHYLLLNSTSFYYLWYRKTGIMSTGDFEFISYRHWTISWKSEIILVIEIILEKHSPIKVWPGTAPLNSVN